MDSPLLPLAHLTCAAHHRGELVELMQRYRRAGVDNLLALHGDPPLSATEELPRGRPAIRGRAGPARARAGLSERRVGVHPEGHPAALSREADWRHQAAKLHEADFGLTQFFHRGEDYFALVDEMRARGADAPIVPGIMPITNVRQVKRMAAMSGTSLPVELAERLRAVADRPTRFAGSASSTRRCSAVSCSTAVRPACTSTR